MGGHTIEPRIPPLEQRGGRVTRMPSRRSSIGSEPFPMPIDPQPFDFDELQNGQAHNLVNGYAGRTRANFPHVSPV